MQSKHGLRRGEARQGALWEGAVERAYLGTQLGGPDLTLSEVTWVR